MFSVIAILENFIFLEALKNSKIPYLFLTYLFSGEFHLTVCSCHVTYAFQSESTLYSCLNVKELLA